MITASSSTSLRSRWTHLAVTVMCVLALFGFQMSAASAAEINVAGLVVDYGDGRMSYAWVPFEEDEISGVELLERSGLDIVTVGFGGLGDAVCQIEITGCPIADCRQRMCQTSDPESPFWQYARQTEPGTWTVMALGASATKVRDGDIDSWNWRGTSPELPALSLDEIAELAGGDPSLLEDGAMDVPAAVRTDAADEESDDSIEGAGVALVGAVAAVAVFAVWRARSASAAASTESIP